MQSWFVLSQVAPTSGPAVKPEAVPQTLAPGGATPATGPADKGPGAAQQTGNPLMQFMPIILILAVMYLFLFRGKGKEAKQQKAMLEALKRGDRVMTIGGLIGSVVEVRGDEVVLKVDESNNVKERYVKSAIQKVLVDGEKLEDVKK